MKKEVFILFCITHFVFSQTEEVTFTEHISPIIYNNCTECHRPNESGPMSFTSYLEVASMASMIVEVTQSGYMPPWPADPNYSSMLGERFLSDDEKELISQWVAQGYPEGELSLEAPIPTFPEGSAVGEPDLIFTMEEDYFIEGNNYDDYRVFVFQTGFTEDKYIRSIEFRPDNREAVHHAIIMADLSGEGQMMDDQSPDTLGYESFGGFGLTVPPSQYVFLGGYAPGMNPIVWSNDLGMKIPAGADILCQIHYAPSSIDEWDKSSINIFFKDAAEVNREVQMKMWVEPDLFIPANNPEVVVEECLNFAPFPMNYIGIQDCSLPEDWSILGILPHCHLIGQSWEVYAETPEGETLPIIKIPDWDFNWQGFYYPEYMQHIPEGSTIKGICIYDNSSDNPLNPNNPPENMGWGELTTNEMFFCPIYYVPYQEGDENIYLGLEEETAIIEHPSVIVSIFPNPSLDYIDINFNLEQNDYLKCYLYDFTGRLLNVIFDENFKSGANSIKLDVAALSTGTYFVNIQTNKQTVTRSFIKE